MDTQSQLVEGEGGWFKHLLWLLRSLRLCELALGSRQLVGGGHCVVKAVNFACQLTMQLLLKCGVNTNADREDSAV